MTLYQGSGTSNKTKKRRKSESESGIGEDDVLPISRTKVHIFHWIIIIVHHTGMTAANAVVIATAATNNVIGACRMCSR